MNICTIVTSKIPEIYRALLMYTCLADEADDRPELIRLLFPVVKPPGILGKLGLELKLK